MYTFFDLAQVARRCCTPDEVAISVLATVISHQPAHRRLIIDAGGLALSKDTSAAAVLPDTGYGWICDLGTCRVRILWNDADGRNSSELASETKDKGALTG